MTSKLDKVIVQLEAGKPKQALSLVRKLNQNKKLQSYHSLLSEAFCYIELGYKKRGLEMLDKYYFKATEPAALFSAANNVYRALVKAKSISLAIPYLLFAIEQLTKRQTLPLRYILSNCYKEKRDFVQAIEGFKALLVYKEYTLKCLNHLVAIGITLSNYDLVQKYLKQMHGYIAQLDLENLKILIERSELHLDADIRPLLVRAKDMGCEDNFIYYIKARQDFKNNNLKSALKNLQLFDSDLKTSFNLHLGYYNLLGKVHLAMNDVDASFQSFEKMNSLMSSTFPNNWQSFNILPKLRSIGPLIKRNTKFKSPIKLAFLVGFPRSGTTLLEHVLDSQAGLLALGEKHTIDAVIEKINEDGYTYPEDLNKLSDDYVDELKAYYFFHIEKYLGDKKFKDYQLLVDKNPQLLMKLPVLMTLFPEAKVILSIRHPLDCILSCFQQNFHYRRNLAYFTDWQLSFERYKEVFDNYRAYQDTFEWQECRVRYEDLTANFADCVERTLAFLEIDVEKSAYLNFTEQAKKSIITTPSINQVKKGIYSKKVFNWESHLKYIAPHWHTVKHHIEYLGYSTEQIEQAIKEAK